MSLAAEKRRKAKALKDAGAALSVKLIARSTRGQRIGELQGEDAEADETFWGQGAWQVEDDSDFSTEEEESDKFDDDFDESESDNDDDGTEETALRKKERAAKRKRPTGGVYKEPKRVTGVKQKKNTTPSAGEEADEGGSAAVAVDAKDGKRQSSSSRIDEQDFAPIQRSVRASTKNKTQKSVEEREGEARAREALPKRPTGQPKKLQGQFTQEQMLAEAIQTEQENMRWILKQQRLEDEAKEDEARPKTHKALGSRWVSRRGCIDAIFFPDASSLPRVLCQPVVDPDGEESKTTALCKITGAPAKYKDPLTGFPYADAAAFRELRRKYGPSARRRKAAQQERETKDVDSSVGPGLLGAGTTGGRGDNGTVTGGAGETGVAAGNSAAAAGGTGTGATRPASGDHGGSHAGSGQGKKQSASKEGEKKTKSSANKGKGKTGGKASSKAAAAAKAEAPAAPGSVAGGAGARGSGGGDEGTPRSGKSESKDARVKPDSKEPRAKAETKEVRAKTEGKDLRTKSEAKEARVKADSKETRVKSEAKEARVRPDSKEKPAAKRPRKLSSSTKSSKSAKRSFFAPAAAATSTPLAGSMVELVPLRGQSAPRRDETWAGHNAMVSRSPGVNITAHGTLSTQGVAAVNNVPKYHTSNAMLRDESTLVGSSVGTDGSDNHATNGMINVQPLIRHEHEDVDVNGGVEVSEDSIYMGWQQPVQGSPSAERPPS